MIPISADHGHPWPTSDTSSHLPIPQVPPADLADLQQATRYWSFIATGDPCYDCFTRLMADAAAIVTAEDLDDVERQHQIFRYLEGRLQDCHPPADTYDLCHRLVIGAYRARCVELALQGKDTSQ